MPAKPKDEPAHIAFEAQVHSVKVGMVYGDKEATLIMKFRPAKGVVDSLQGLIGGDENNTVMVGIVPVGVNKTTENYNGVQKRTSGKPGRKAQGLEV
jgi:hypothetical protein